METFDCLPISCLINEKFIAIHGGISPDIDKVLDITKINRFTEPPKTGPIQLWDTAGEEKYPTILQIYFRWVNIALLLYDITNPKTFEEVKQLQTSVNRRLKIWKYYPK